MYGCCGSREDGGGRAGLGDPSGVHDRHALAGLGEHGQVVRDQDQREAEVAPQFLQQREHLRLRHHVECRRRLVRDDDLGIAGQGQRDHHALAHAARELVRILAGAIRADADALEQFAHPRAHGRAVGLGIVQADRLADLARDALHGIERVECALEDERDLAPAQVAHAALGAPVHVHDAAVRRQVDRSRGPPQEGVEQLQDRECGGRLAATRLARQAERLAALQLERDARHDLHVALAEAVADVQVVDSQNGIAHCARARGSEPSSMTWPTAKNASTKSVIAAPGGTTYHQAP